MCIYVKRELMEIMRAYDDNKIITMKKRKKLHVIQGYLGYETYERQVSFFVL